MKRLKNILVIDDDPGIVDVIKIILEEKGFEVHTCTDSVQVLDLIKKVEPSLMLLDILMYGKNGVEIIKLLKDTEFAKDIPVIMISASEDTKIIAAKSGANGYIEKPFNIDDLVRIVKKHVS